MAPLEVVEHKNNVVIMYRYTIAVVQGNGLCTETIEHY